MAILSTSNGCLVANRDSGRLAHLEFGDSGKIGPDFSERLATKLSDGAWGDNGVLFLADSASNEIIVVQVNRWIDGRGDVDVRQRIPVNASPVRLAVSPDRRTLAVSSLWARRVQLFDINTDHPRLQQSRYVDLEFSPRELLFDSAGALFVADAFGGKLARIDAEEAKLSAAVVIPAHNIGGLAFEPGSERLMVSHQLLNGFLPNSRDHVFWGNIVTNIMRFLDASAFEKLPGEDGPRELKVHGAIYPLGQERDAAGDPGRMVTTKSGQVAVLLSGVDQIGIRAPGSRDFHRIPVGRGPSAISLLPPRAGHERVAVANKFDDSVSIIDLNDQIVVRTIKLSREVKLTVAQRGEALFHNANISLDGWFSCHSCHTNGHSCDLLNDNLGDDTYGRPKRILSLLGVRHTAPWAWNGQQTSLSGQVRKSMNLTMRGTEQREVKSAEVEAITAFLHTLEHPPGVDIARGNADARGDAGRRLFRQHGCAECHAGDQLTSDGVRPVGLAGDHGLELNPPSLRGVSQRRAWLHDGRAKSLRAVFELADHQQMGDLKSEELDALIAYLRTL